MCALTHTHENMFTHTHTERDIRIYTLYMCIHTYTCLYTLYVKSLNFLTKMLLLLQTDHSSQSRGHCDLITWAYQQSNLSLFFFFGILLSKPLKDSIRLGKEHTPCHHKCLAFIRTLLPNDLDGPILSYLGFSHFPGCDG